MKKFDKYGFCNYSKGIHILNIADGGLYSMKQNSIYYTIRNEIISGVWQKGDKLPTEIEYSE